MRGESPAGSLASTLAKYTMAWSTGIGTGFLLGGIIKDKGGPVFLTGLCVVACTAYFLDDCDASHA
jgi:hypothetical protein